MEIVGVEGRCDDIATYETLVRGGIGNWGWRFFGEKGCCDDIATYETSVREGLGIESGRG